MNAIKDRLANFSPLSTYNFGHSPIQIEHFKTAQQTGNRNFEFWHHVLQLKAINCSITELTFDLEEAEFILEGCRAFWPPWTRSKRKRKKVKLEWQVEQRESSLRQKYHEAELTLDIIEKKFSDLISATEQQLFKSEREYWVTRFSRQLAAAQIARHLGTSTGDIQSIMALPDEDQRKILNITQAIVASNALTARANSSIGE